MNYVHLILLGATHTLTLCFSFIHSGFSLFNSTYLLGTFYNQELIRGMYSELRLFLSWKLESVRDR